MTVYCTRCGAAAEESARFCPACGNAMTPDAATAQAAVAPTPVVLPGTGPLYGGFWVRFVAVLIDAILVGAVTTPLSFFIGLAIGAAGLAVSMPDTGVQLVGAISGLALGVVANWLYEGLMISSAKQATVGKMILRLRVTDLEGNRLSFARASGRHFAKYLSGMILLIGYIMAAFTERHQALHDMIAGTLVRQY